MIKIKSSALIIDRLLGTRDILYILRELKFISNGSLWSHLLLRFFLILSFLSSTSSCPKNSIIFLLAVSIGLHLLVIYFYQITQICFTFFLVVCFLFINEPCGFQSSCLLFVIDSVQNHTYLIKNK